MQVKIGDGVCASTKAEGFAVLIDAVISMIDVNAEISACIGDVPFVETVQMRSFE